MTLLIVPLAAVVATVGQEIPDPVRRALVVLEEARSVAHDAAEGIWPSYDLASIPVALYGDDEAWLVHHPDPPTSFHALELDFLSTEVLRGPRSPAMNANTSGDLAGAVTAFVSIDSLGSGAIAAGDVALVLHEAGHAFRARAPRGGSPRWPAEDALLVSAYPADSAVNNAWGRVEGALLAEALGADDVREPALDFLAVRAVRQGDLDPEIVQFEKHLELNEGLAEYFARRALALAGPTYERTAAAAENGLSAEAYRLDGRRLADDLRRINLGGEGAERQRFYHTGTALGLLLDRLDSTWKESVEQHGADLQALLLAALAPGTPLHERLPRIAAEHGFEDLLQFERASSEALRARRRSTLHTVLAASGPKLVLDLSRAGGAAQVSSFDPMNLVSVEAGVRVHTRMLSLSFAGGSASFEQPVVQDVERGLIITALPQDSEIELDPDGGPSRIGSAGFSVECTKTSWLAVDELLILGPGMPEEELDPAEVLALLEAAREEASRPLPAPPFEAVDVSGAVHRQPEEVPRRTVLVFFSAADWARPSHAFVRDLLSRLEGEALATRDARLLFVASQCTRSELDAFLGNAPGLHVLHDDLRSLARGYDVTQLPSVIWIDARGVIARRASGNTSGNLQAVVDQVLPEDGAR